MHLKNSAIILISFILLNICQLTAQDSSINWYKTKSFFGSEFFNSIKVLNANHNFIWYYKGTGSALNQYDFSYRNTLNIAKFDFVNDTTYTHELNFKVNGETLDLHKVYQQKGMLNVFCTFHNKKTEKFYLFKETYNLNTLQSNNDIKKILEIDLSEKNNIKKLKGYNLVFDNNRYVFYYTCSTKKGDYASIEVLNEKLETEWKTFQPIAVQANYFAEECYRIDGEGNVLMLGRSYNSSKDTRKNFSESTLNLVYYSKSGDNPKVIPIMLKNNYFITGANLAIAKNNEIVLTGLYANTGLTSAIGCFSKIYDLTLINEKSCHLSPIPKDILLKGENEKVVSLVEKNKDFEDFFTHSCDSIHFKENGDFDYIVEKTRVIIKTTKSGTYYSFAYDDIYAISFTSNGSVKWIQKAPKKTTLEDSNRFLGGYSLIYDNNENIHLIFNDFAEKVTVLSGLTKLKINGQTKHVIIDKNGNEKVSVLFDKPNVPNSICSQYSIKTTNNTILIPRYPYLFEGLFSKKNRNIEFGELKLY